MLEQLKWLGDKEEVAFEQHKFRGKLAGKAYKYSQNIDGLIRVRLLMVVTAILMFKPIITNYLFHGLFDSELLVERIIFFVMLLVGALLFNKFRIPAIILASIPVLLIIYTYLVNPEYFDLRIIAFNIALLGIFLSGIYHNHRIKTLRNELEQNLSTAQLIEDQ